MKKIVLLLLMFLSAVLQFNCAHSKKYATMKTAYDPKEKIQIDMMEGNELPNTINDIFKTKACSLNPGRIISNAEGTYFILNFFYSSYSGDFMINAGDSMNILADRMQIQSTAYYSNVERGGISAFYRISMLDLNEIGNAETVKIIVHGSEDKIEKELNPKNINNFKRFVNEYILNVDNNKEPILKEKQIRGFIGIGKGTGYNLYLAYYLNLLKIEQIPELGDFAGIGFGYSSFNYDRYYLSGYSMGTPPRFDYEYLDNKKNSIYTFKVIYGFTHPSKIGDWSIEAGISLNYYYVVQNDWNIIQKIETVYGEIPDTKYYITNGKLFEELSVGFFLQAGIIWFTYDSQYAWAIGFSIPVRF